MVRAAVIQRWPEDDDELHAFVAAVWNFDIPREKVCADHTAPFDAFADAFFARHPVTVWKASRGLGGKSTLLGVLALTEAVVLGAQITVLGGSASQSQRVHDVTKESWNSPLSPVQLRLKDPTMYDTYLTNSGHIRALMASQTSVRGPHPQRLRLDEIDEMELPILDASMGQPMEKFINGRLVETQTVMSSTHQYPDKTMTAILKRATAQGWPVYHWCYKESMGTKANPGWLSERMVIRKKAEVSQTMWDIEYELQEPSFEGRAIDEQKVKQTFTTILGEFEGREGQPCQIEGPQDEVGRRYITAIDWAKEKDWTIIATFRCDVVPWICVSWRRLGRRPWPEMVGYAQDRVDQYGGFLVHDNTGLGDVVADLLNYDRRYTVDVTMVGAARSAMFNEYIVAVESGQFRYPRIEFAFNEHKYVTADDLYGRGHAPDSFVVGSLAWSLRTKVMSHEYGKPIQIVRQKSPWVLS